MHNMLAFRRLHPTFGTGDFTALDCNDESIIAFTRSSAEETLLVAANLSATARSSTIKLPGYAGWTLTDVFGGAGFPSVGDDGILTMTWGARDFYWLVLAPPAPTATAAPGGQAREA
jgi:maltose alpha-D-glucosyltransferase/alpha-amylase